ncbi:Dehydration-responsive protein RD22 [Spatholobus suberectus]|nr:Dehydration-responsive protein RD22 [Spatholobus suberectus]
MPKALTDLTQSGVKSYAKVGNNKIDVDVYGAANKDNDPTKLKLDAVINVTFFFEHDLRSGKKFNLEVTKRSDEITFLPDTVAKSIPFSSSRFFEILNHFNIEAESTDAEAVKYTLEICENPAIRGEDKYCATSLESLLSFTVSKLGKNIRVLSTVLENEKQEQEQKQKQYSVVEGVQKVGDKAVACHKLNYPYAVFYCHKVATRAYAVPLVATDDAGTKVKALAVCHTDTITWSRKNLAFEQLNVKPGTVPVCHFLATDTLLWVPN